MPPCDATILGVPSVQTLIQLVGNLEAFNSISKDGVPAEGLTDDTKWTITDSAGGVSNPTTVTENFAGNYTFDYVAVAAGDATFYYLDTNFEVSFVATLA